MYDHIVEGFSLHKAGGRWSVPVETLRRYVLELSPQDIDQWRLAKGQVEANVNGEHYLNDSPDVVRRIMGHATVLTENEEDTMVQMVLAMAERNLPLSRCTLVDLANKMLRTRKGATLRDTPMVGKGWCRGFLGRHQNLSMRTPEALSLDRDKHTSEEAILPHLQTLETVLERHNLWKDGRRIWNADETGLKLGERGRTKVIAGRGVHKVHTKAPSDTRHVSVMFAVNAAAERSPPALILPSSSTPKELWDSIARLDDSEEWSTVCEKKGFITEISFYDWLKLFVQFLDENVRRNNEREEHLLIVDQCSSHSSLRILEYAEQHSVLLYALPPHTTHYTQPVDVGLFGPFKEYYSQEEQKLLLDREGEYQRRMRAWKGEENKKPVLRAVTINDIPTILKPALDRAFTKHNVESAFRTTGIYPFSREALLSKVRKPHELPAVALPDEQEDNTEEDAVEVAENLRCYEERMTAQEIVEVRADAESYPRPKTARSKWARLPYCGLMRLKDYIRIEQEKERVQAEKQELAADRQQRKRERELEREQRREDHQEKRRRIAEEKETAGRKGQRTAESIESSITAESRAVEGKHKRRGKCRLNDDPARKLRTQNRRVRLRASTAKKAENILQCRKREVRPPKISDYERDLW